MFENLTDRISSALDKLRSRGTLTEDMVKSAMRDIRIALLEADVALSVAKDFVNSVTEKATGEEVLKAVSPGQQVTKIVHDELVSMLGAEHADLNLLSNPPTPIMLVGLQGSGKTTTTAKLANLLNQKRNKKCLMVSLDVYRPAAREQLQTLGTQAGIDTLDIIEAEDDPIKIAKRGWKQAKTGGYDVVFFDTAGRLTIDDTLMDELARLEDLLDPDETLLIADAMTGQDAVQVADGFSNQLEITGICLTRMDGDTRGGAALSMKAVTGQPIKFIGTGENIGDLAEFHPDRMADRILGMGDVVSLVEKAQATIEEDEAKAMAERMKAGEFDLNDYLSQIGNMQKMGGMGGIMKLLPGVGDIQKHMDKAGVNEDFFTRQQAIIQSMTPTERSNPKILNASRRKRIANGSGTKVQDINQLIKQFRQMKKMMQKMAKMGGGFDGGGIGGGMMGAMKGLFGK